MSSTKNSLNHLPDERDFVRDDAETGAGAASGGLKKSIGLLSACGFVITAIIGAGIFVSPKEVAEPAGTPIASLSIWLLAGIYVIMAAYCYAELGLLMPETGGEYVYLRRIFGDFFGFLYIWMLTTILMPAATATMALSFARYLLAAFDYVDDAYYLKIIATFMVLLLTIVNASSVKLSSAIGNVTTVIKLAALFVIIAVGLWYISQSHVDHYLSWEELNQNYTEPGFTVAGGSVAFYGAMFSFQGWQYLNLIIEELHNPARNLPLALFFSMPMITIVYVVVNVVYFAVLGGSTVATSAAVAADFSKIVIPIAAFSVPLFVCVSCFGALTAQIFAFSRLTFSAARNNHLPVVFSSLHRTQATPVPSLILTAVITWLLIWIAEISTLVSGVGFISSAVTFLSICGLLKLRYTDPDVERKVKPFIIIPIIVAIWALGMMLIPLLDADLGILVAAAVSITGIPVYFLGVHWDTKPDGYHTVMGFFTTALQRLTWSEFQRDGSEKEDAAGQKFAAVKTEDEDAGLKGEFVKSIDE